MRKMRDIVMCPGSFTFLSFSTWVGCTHGGGIVWCF